MQISVQHVEDNSRMLNHSWSLAEIVSVSVSKDEVKTPQETVNLGHLISELQQMVVKYGDLDVIHFLPDDFRKVTHLADNVLFITGVDIYRPKRIPSITAFELLRKLYKLHDTFGDADMDCTARDRKC